MKQQPLDLSPLDPTRDKNRFDRTVGALTARILRARRRSTMTVLSRLFVPAVALATLALALTTTILLTGGGQRPRPPRADGSSFAQWARGKTTLSSWDAVDVIRRRQ